MAKTYVSVKILIDKRCQKCYKQKMDHTPTLFLTGICTFVTSSKHSIFSLNISTTYTVEFF